MTALSGRTRRVGTALAVGGLTLSAAGLALGPGISSASSHREAPLTAANPLVDSTDMYAYRSPDAPDTVTLNANWIPFQEPAGGPNFYPFGAAGYRYNIKVDNNGDAKPDITYRWTFKNIDMRGDSTFLYNNGAVNSFDDKTLLFKQTYTLESIDAAGKATTLVSDGKTAPSYVGDASMPNYAALREEAITTVAGGKGQSFAGQADDPFFLDLRIFDLLYGADLSEVGNNSLTRYNVNNISLQMPIADLTKGGDGSGIIGVWQTTDQQSLTLSDGKATPGGDYVQVSRLGAPLVNEVVLPVSLKDAFNALKPENDASVTAAVNKVKDPEVPKLIEKIYGIPAPAAPRDDLVAAFLTGIKGLNQPPTVQPAEMMRLNTKVPVTKSPNRLGVLAKDNQGFPNGRRLTDDVVDIELQALEGAITKGIIAPLAAGDGVDANDKAFGTSFPYLALPTSGSNTQPRGSGGSNASGGTGGGAPSGGVNSGFGGLAGDDESLPVLPMSLALGGVVLAGAGFVLRRRSA